jgi:hypothetical protein
MKNQGQRKFHDTSVNAASLVRTLPLAHESTRSSPQQTKHKLGRLPAKTITRILENPETPTSVRAIVEQYLDERPGAVRSQRVAKPFDKTDRTG